jgi:hypothetical protein
MGLVSVGEPNPEEFIKVEGPTAEELLAEKEAELIKIYKEIQELQNNIN